MKLLIPSMEKAIEDFQLTEQMGSRLFTIKSDFEKYEQRVLPLLDHVLNNPSDKQKMAEVLILICADEINQKNASFCIKEMRQLSEEMQLSVCGNK